MKLSLLIVLQYAVSLFAQPFTNFSVTNGLPDNHVKGIIQDHNGFIWFGTQNGLARFDGYEFRVFKNDPDNSRSLSNNGIWIIIEGKSGCLWIGTQNGDLNKYDPQKNIFDHLNICRSKDGENYISCLYEDVKGNIWIGTYNKGLYKFNPSDNSINHWVHNNNDANSISNDFINAIISDKEGNLWIGTYSGLNKFCPSKNNKIFEKYFDDGSDPNTLTSNLIWNITQSNLNPDLFYIGTYRGLTILNAKSTSFTRLLPVKNPVNQFSNSIGSVIEKNSGKNSELWLGGYGGLIKYVMSTKQTFQWHHNHKLQESLISEKINNLMIDKSGVLWIATEDGVSCLSEKILKFKNDALQNFSESDRKNIGELEIRSIARTENGGIFLGTTKGLKYISKINGTPKLVTVPQFNGIDIWSLANGKSNVIWIGTYGKGLYNYNPLNSKVNHILFHSPTDRITPYNYVKSVLEDDSGRVWVGFWGGGLALINTLTGRQIIFRKELNNFSSISFNDVWKIYQDSFGRIWVCTNGGGLNLYENKNGKLFSRISEGKIISNNVLCMCEQKNDLSSKNTILWVGTTEGLIKLEIKNSTDYSDIDNLIKNSKHYTGKNGLANNVISQIVEDDNENLWITTNFGLSKFLTKEEKFINFSSYDGLTGNNFSEGALLKSRDGFIYAGSSQGLNVFDPEQVKLSGFHSKIVFTGFMIQNNQVEVSDNSLLKTDIAFTKEIKLKYNQNSFTLFFSSLDYNAPQLVDFSYLLDGFDKEWSSTKNINYASYTNLDPGSYILKVRSTNSDKVWQNTPSELTILISPPWWKTDLAYLTYIFLIISGFFAIKKFQQNRNELRNELKMHEYEAKKHQELENLKSRFFANLSHEFRTPLMLIKGPVEQLLNKLSSQNPEPEELNEKLNMIMNNSTKLQLLIDQLLELSQLETASIPVKAKQGNLISLTRGLVSTFESYAIQKNVKLILNCPFDTLIIWIDRDKFEKIINNLLSNAFKFTQPGGSVSVGIDYDEITKEVKIKIADTGIGIPDDKIDKIFNRFFQVDDSSSRAYGGSGIGLALVKELIELHRWKISVRSEINKGTEFTLLIPAEDYLDENQKIFEKNSSPETNGKVYEDNGKVFNGEYSTLSETKNRSNGEKGNAFPEHITVLIIDDSVDVRKYLSDILKSCDLTGVNSGVNSTFSGKNCIEILEAGNGEEGLKTAAEKLPDLIISDIMMPYMDGIEFCSKLKTNWETSHIPVILLTAKASSESKIEGLETGADDYLTKPFDSTELYIRIKNLLQQRIRLKEKYSRKITFSSELKTPDSADDEFLNKAISIIEQNLSKNDFGIEGFAREMALSRSQLHRKIISATGVAPGEFLRNFRLNRASRMLVEKKLNITQIAFEVGFNSPSHFTKAFSQYFNCLPSDFTSKVSLSGK